MTSESADTGQAPRSEPSAAPSPWPGHVRALGVEFCRWAMRPRVRLTMTGVILILAGGVFAKSSMWTLPLLIAGALMVAVAWVGHRLDGRLALEWGETGTQLEFRAQIKAPEDAYPALPAPPRAAEPEPEDADVVEGESHTVEIEVAELKALIAAASSAEVSAAEAESGGLGTRPLGVASAGNGAARAAEGGPERSGLPRRHPQLVLADANDVTGVELAASARFSLAVDGHLLGREQGLDLGAAADFPGELEQLPEPDRVAANGNLVHDVRGRSRAPKRSPVEGRSA